VYDQQEANMSAFDVIFIDDEVSLTEIFQHYVLAKHVDWRFTTFSNASLAYQEILNRRLAATVWILDLMMPGRNGAEIAEAVRQRGGAAPVLVAYTALDSQQIQDDEYYRERMGHFNTVINKKEDIASVLSLVDVWVQQARNL